MTPGHRITQGTRKPPSQFVSFSPLNGVMPPSGQVHDLGAIIGGVDDNRIIGDLQVLELLQELAYMSVSLYHAVCVDPQSRLSFRRRLEMRPDMHTGCVEPDEERFVRLVGAVDEVECRLQKLLIHRLHPLRGEGTCVLHLPVRGRLEHAARAVPLPECRVFRIILVFRLLLGVHVVQVPEEFIEAMVRGQEFILVTQVVLAKLACHVTQGLQQFCNGRVLGTDADISAREANLGEPGSKRRLAGDEGGPAGCAALLAVVVGEHRAFLGNAVDVGGAGTPSSRDCKR